MVLLWELIGLVVIALIALAYWCYKNFGGLWAAIDFLFSKDEHDC